MVSLVFAALHFLQPPDDVAIFVRGEPIPAGAMFIDPESRISGFRLLQAIAMRFQDFELVLFDFVSLTVVGLILAYARYASRGARPTSRTTFSISLGVISRKALCLSPLSRSPPFLSFSSRACSPSLQRDFARRTWPQKRPEERASREDLPSHGPIPRQPEPRRSQRPEPPPSKDPLLDFASSSLRFNCTWPPVLKPSLSNVLCTLARFSLPPSVCSLPGSS
jgi:hypothetical protein